MQIPVPERAATVTARARGAIAPGTVNTEDDTMKKPFYKILYVQVLFAILVGILLGHYWPDTAVAMKPLGVRIGSRWTRPLAAVFDRGGKLVFQSQGETDNIAQGLADDVAVRRAWSDVQEIIFVGHGNVPIR